MLPELSSLLALKLNSKRFFHFNSTIFYYAIKGCNYKATPILLKNNSVYVTIPNNNHLHSTFQRIIHDKKRGSSLFMEIPSWNDLVPNSYSNVSLFSRSERARATFSSCASCELVARDDDVLRRSLQTFEHGGTGKRRSTFLSALPPTDRNTCNGGRKI